MQNKGAVKLLAVLLTLVCIYQLSFTLVTKNTEANAKKYAKGNLIKESNYLDSISGKTVYNLLWLRKFSFKECKEREINLGLDLKGGMNVILEVSVPDLILSLSNYNKDTTFQKALEKAKKMRMKSQKDFITLFGEAFKEVDANARLAAIFNTIELKDKITYNSTNEEVIKVIREQTNAAIDNSFKILRTRIDKFGVIQPNIQRMETAGRLQVELPGVKDPKRVRKLLQGTANLEFWETYENSQVIKTLWDANNLIAKIESSKEPAIDSTLLKKGAKPAKSKGIEKVIKADSTKEGLALLNAIKNDTNKKDSSLLASQTSK